MALIRCPKHGIPFNDDNPRGCPACALEKEGGEQAQVMRELARASQVIRRPGAPPGPGVDFAPRRSERFTAPVTAPPRAPVFEPGPLDKLRLLVRRRPVPVIGIPLIVILLVALISRSGPSFVRLPSPVPLTGEVLPLPIEPGASLSTVFGVLGVQPPRPSPEGRALERYSYGTDLYIDALNGVVYIISMLVPNRSWHGLRVGIPLREAEGSLALLGPPQPAAPPVMPRADTLRGVVVYPSLAGRPNRPLKAEVRPPNGCYDVVVDIQPQATGVLVDRDRRYAVIGPPEAQLEWVATRVQVINRAVAGPAGPAVC
ncbi:MAG: hypothetical protein HYV20_17265 [Gemmatimonadetes bacterium]|nr:hypothetical protein [Gemmatimonadota bacterium]